MLCNPFVAEGAQGLIILHKGPNWGSGAENYTPSFSCKVHPCHRLNCDHNQGGVMGSVLMCIFSVD